MRSVRRMVAPGLAVVTFPIMVGACAPQPAGRQSSTADASMLAALDERVPRWLAQYQVPSISIAYVRNGAIAWTRAYGEQAEGVPATGWTLYNAASLTKPVFAELVVRLAAAGKLSLDEPMAPYWADPDVARDARHTKLTPRMALSHRIGFANWRRETKDTLRGTRRGRGSPGSRDASRCRWGRTASTVGPISRRTAAPLTTSGRRPATTRSSSSAS